MYCKPQLKSGCEKRHKPYGRVALSKSHAIFFVTPPKFNVAPEKWWLEVGSLLSFWDGIFSGAMLNFQGVRWILLKIWCSYKKRKEEQNLQRNRSSCAEHSPWPPSSFPPCFPTIIIPAITSQPTNFQILSFLIRVFLFGGLHIYIYI